MKYRFIHEWAAREFEQFTVEADSLEEAWRQYHDRYDTDLIDEAEMLDDWARLEFDLGLVEVLDENDENLKPALDAWLKEHPEEDKE
jgi:hypothetical protein